ncbi:MAG TPA: YidC/Oxa1 family membrane protein insertase [Candidatus Saccharimonadales bacterium]|nr:YidC/Oxa1 family membrane protein insertase [Candidatus Saccharimonadales bacterium]
MSPFDLILIQPIFNVLIVIYGLLPGHDYGLALIIFTILTRLAMWPMVKRQLHQTKVMRELQPELAKIKAKAKGNKQLESRLMLELYREKGVNPFGSIGMLIVQLPIFIALFAVVKLIAENHANIAKFTYDFFESIPAIKGAIATHVDQTLFGVIDLAKHAVMPNSGDIYWPLMVLAVVAAALQFYQSKQLLPQPKEKRKLRDILKEQAAGKEVDQAEISALMTGKMVWLFPALTFLLSVYLQGALVLYLVVSSAVAIFQQARILSNDESELEKLSEKTKTKVKKAVQAEVVEKPAVAANKKKPVKKGATKAKKKRS